MEPLSADAARRVELASWYEESPAPHWEEPAAVTPKGELAVSACRRFRQKLLPWPDSFPRAARSRGARFVPTENPERNRHEQFDWGFPNAPASPIGRRRRPAAV